LAAIGCGLAFALLLILAYAFGPAEQLDVRAHDGFATLRASDAESFAPALVDSGNPLEVVLIMAGICGLGLLWGRPWHVGAAIWVVAVSSIASQALKVVLASSRAEPMIGDSIDAAAFPSGHATAVMSLAVALVLVMPKRLRPAAAFLGALYVLAASISIVVLGGHYPSDVVAGMLLATGLGFVALAGLRRYAPAEPGQFASGGISQVGAVEFVLICAGTFGVVVAVSQGGGVLDYARDQTAAAATGVLVAASAAALLSCVALLARD